MVFYRGLFQDLLEDREREGEPREVTSARNNAEHVVERDLRATPSAKRRRCTA